MENKIAFLCVNPWENFLSPIFQSSSREYYHWIREMVVLQKIKPYCQELLEIYGEYKFSDAEKLFSDRRKGLQLLYVQSSCGRVIEEVFRRADVVVMGLPGCKKEFDKTFMTIFPWKDHIKFFWDSHICRDETFIMELCREYKLHAAQIFEIKRDIDGNLRKI